MEQARAPAMTSSRVRVCFRRSVCDKINTAAAVVSRLTTDAQPDVAEARGGRGRAAAADEKDRPRGSVRGVDRSCIALGEGHLAPVMQLRTHLL